MRPYREYDFTLPPVEACNYGVEWPEVRGQSTDQITKELLGFRLNGKKKGFMSRYEHGLKLIQLLWPDQVRLYRRWRHYKTGEEVIIWNHYFLRAFRALCTGRRVAFTGCSSSGKTFAVAVYCVLMFMCDPQNTTIMVSTTAGTDAERRVWGEIKDLHNALKERYPVGNLIDYLKVITFDPGQELAGRKDVSARDLRNGIILIPIPKGSEGDNALGKIIGTKNRTVIWVIDEMPHMMDNVTRPESNLLSNRFQLIGIGNANRKSDPHGLMCEPVTGWDSISVDDDEWEGFANTLVLFFHGEESPNFHPAVDQSTEDRDKYPFPYLSSPQYIREVAEINGRGNAEFGRKTIDFMRFAIGFWYGDDIANTILSPQAVKEFKANLTEVDWGPKPITLICGGDFAFTADGDSNELCFARLGEDFNGYQRLVPDEDSVTIRSTAQDKESYWTDVGKQAVAIFRERGLRPEHFGMDINADGGKMMQAIQRVWNTHNIVGLSSLEQTEDKSKYDNIVTQYWYQVYEAVATGCVRGFNLISKYAKDLCNRQYESVGKGRVKVEQKKEMKKRIKRSPDAGDAFAYMIEMAKRAGFDLTYDRSPENIAKIRQLNDRFSNRDQLTDEEDDYVPHQQAISEEVEYV